MRVSCGSDPLFGCQQNLAGAEELFSSFKILCWKSTHLRFLNSMGQCLCIAADRYQMDLLPGERNLNTVVATTQTAGLPTKEYM